MRALKECGGRLEVDESFEEGRGGKECGGRLEVYESFEEGR